MDVVIGQLFTGLSIGSILLLAALGLSLTFGQMGVINMAHGEFIMAGSYTAYVVQQIVSTGGASLFISLIVGFLVGFAAGGADDYYWWNIGGWNNTRSVLQRASGGGANEVQALEGRSLVTGQDYRVKVVVSGRTIELYLDGVLQMTYTEPASESLYQVVTHDEETGALTLKVVNPHATTARTTVQVTGGMQVAEEVGVTRQGLAKALGEGGNPTLATLLALARALGFRMTIEPIAAE